MTRRHGAWTEPPPTGPPLLGRLQVSERLLPWMLQLERSLDKSQRRGLLADVKSNFEIAVPHELVRERRLLNVNVWVVKASFGVTKIWFRRYRQHGWSWSTDLGHWQSAASEPRIGGDYQGIRPVRSNRYLLRRLKMRDMLDCVRPGRAAHAPPPLSLPDDLEEDPSVPAEFVCPIAHTVMTDPVVGPAGVSYERAALRTPRGCVRASPSPRPLRRATRRARRPTSW